MRFGRIQVAATLVLLCTAGCARGGPNAVLGRTPSPDEGYGLSTSAGAGITGTQALTALLEPADLGPSFTQSPVSSAAFTAPCALAGTPPLTAQLPPTLSVGRGFAGGTPAAVVFEELDIYADAVTAIKAVALSTRGMDCPVGKSYQVDGTFTQMGIQGPNDLTAGVGKPAESVTAWVLSSSQAKGSIAVVRIGAKVLILTYAATLGSEPLQLTAELPLIKLAVAKLARLP